jgi:uncharacterized surface protein with fasciclin (FAS1) repeats
MFGYLAFALNIIDPDPVWPSMIRIILITYQGHRFQRREVTALLTQITLQMKKLLMVSAIASLSMFAISCVDTTKPKDDSQGASSEVSGVGQSGVKDDVSQKTVVGVAVGSKDHTTLVKAIQQAKLVDVLSNAGPFTVFAPTNAAFDQLPAGTLDNLMKEENREKLADILQYHVSVGVFKEDILQDGQIIGQVNGGNITINKSGGVITVNGKAKVIATVPASNGLVYVVDGVLLPK